MTQRAVFPEFRSGNCTSNVMMLVPCKHIASELLECPLNVGTSLGATNPP